MIDLSSNNGEVNFKAVRAAGQYRVYLKRSEGITFTDPDYNQRYQDARAAGLRVGAYHYARPSLNSPETEAQFFARLLGEPEPGFSLIPMIDLEDPDTTPSANLGMWAARFAAYIVAHTKWPIGLYGYYSYLQGCEFTKAGAAQFEGVWIAAYGRNNGKEYPFGTPTPWTDKDILAQQICDTGHVPGCTGAVDLSVVFKGKLDILPHGGMLDKVLGNTLGDWQ